MRKFTLILASLFLNLGVWAQTPVLTYENITAPQELSAEDATKIRKLSGMTIVADVNITNSSNVSLLFAAVADYTFSSTDNNTIWGVGAGGNALRYYVGPRQGGWYSSTDGSLTTTAKKIIFTYDGTTIKYYVDGDHVKDQNSTKALNSFTGGNAKFYLGGVVYNTTTEWGNFNGTIKKVEIYSQVLGAEQIKSLVFPEGFVATAEDFDNNKIYTFVTERGWMGAKADNDKVISTVYSSNSGVSYGKDEANFQWAVYKSANNNYYLYNIGKQKFMGVQKSNNTAISFVDTPAGKDLTFKTSNVKCYPIMFSTDNAAVVNHSANHNPGIVSWTGGWNNLTDQGSNHQVIAVGELDKETLAKIETEVAKIEVDNTQEVAALGAAITKAQNFFNLIGSGVGKYSTTNENAIDEFTAIKSFHEAIESKENPTPAVVEAKTAEVEALIASFSLNMPEAGKFYTFNNDSYYITCNTIETGNKNIALNTVKNDEVIYYFDGDHLLAYKTGLYIGLNETDWGFEAESSNDISKIKFVAAANGTVAKYNISSGGRWLHRTNDYVNRCSSNTCGNAHNWTIEEVTMAAKIGDKQYYTLGEAVAAANEATVTVLTDIELTETVVIPAGKTITLDLNGKTVSQTKECTASYEMISNKGDLTIKNGTLRFTDTSAGDPTFGWGSYTVRNEGNLVIEDATIEHLGEQAFATHCIMALFQYSGSTIINGGTISTPNYRSVRLWEGDMTINGGIFNGQVWLQAVDNTANLTINGGTFAPRGNDGSSVYVDNSSKTVSFAVTGGNFTTKIGAANPTAIAGAITGGNFTQNAMNGTNKALLGDGLSFGDVAEGNDYYTLFTLREDVAYENDSDMKINGKIAYTRNLTAFWNPIYLPFDVTLSTADYDVAKFESAEGETVTLTKIEGATAALEANTAYVIRPKNEAAKTLTITLENATLKAVPADVEAMTKGLGTDFSVRGNYSVLTGADLEDNDRVVGTNGNWGVLKSTSTLKPFRLILSIPAGVDASAISMRVEGEDATSIENLGITIESEVIYDLMGRRVETMTEGGIYIVNGKKIVF